MQVLGLFMVVSVFTSTGSASGDQMELHSVSPAALIRDQPFTGAQTAAGPKLLTKDGLIQGLALDKCYVFYGIPFADPPVAASRWKPPRPVTPWRGVYDATYPRAACMQACIGPIADECLKKVSGELNTYIRGVKKISRYFPGILSIMIIRGYFAECVIVLVSHGQPAPKVCDILHILW